MRIAGMLFGLALVACSKSEPAPAPAPAPAPSASSVEPASESGTCDWGAKCAEWTGQISAKKKTCGLLAGTWSEAPCGVKKAAVAECAITGTHVTGTIYYGAPTRSQSEHDCQRQGGVHRFVKP